MSWWRGRADVGQAPDAMDFGGSNPLLVEFLSLRDLDSGSTATQIDELIATYSFAIPTDRALEAVQRHAPYGVVEIGAGTGYWASLLYARGVPTVAYDVAPPMSPDNKWFHSSTGWFDVQEGDETMVAHHADRALLLVWPTRDQTWPADALDHFSAAGGRTVIYVGEAAGQSTGDARFHALLGGYERCLACAYDAPDLACVCGIRPMWRQVEHTALPHWPGRNDDLYVYGRREPPGSALHGERRRGVLGRHR